MADLQKCELYDFSLNESKDERDAAVYPYIHKSMIESSSYVDNLLVCFRGRNGRKR